MTEEEIPDYELVAGDEGDGVEIETSNATDEIKYCDFYIFLYSLFQKCYSFLFILFVS
jgi:hypothetical protein